MAKQRVDNFAAGFIAAGAAAVVAEAYASPNHMVRSVLAGRGGIEIRLAPRTERERQHASASRARAATGYVAQMDPERGDSGFTRSIVLKRGLASKDVLQPRPRSSRRQPPDRRPGVTRPEPVRDRPDDQDADPPVDASRARRCGTASRTPSGPATSCPMTSRRASAGIRSTPQRRRRRPIPKWHPTSVSSRRNGSATWSRPSALRIDKKNLSIRVSAPAAPGRYRLSVSLHDKEGVAYDATSQAMLPSLIVRLTGPHDAGVVGPDALEIAPGAAHKLALWVTNLGHQEWGQKAVPGAKTVDNARNPTGSAKATNARLVGTWVSLGGVDDPAQTEAAAAASVRATALPPGFAPRAVTKAEVLLFAPSAPGDYLLVVDIVTPEIGSLAAQGVDPTIVRVHVARSPGRPGRGAGGGPRRNGRHDRALARSLPRRRRCRRL